MRCDYICGHVRCRHCHEETRGPRAYFRCCQCKKLRPLSRTGNKHNNRTKANKKRRLARIPAREQLNLYLKPPIRFIGLKPATKEKRP